MSGLAQPAQKGPGTDLSEAENRLSEMRTQEVGIVDAAANLRPFLTMKNKDGMAATSKQDAPPAATPAAGGTPEAKDEHGLTLTTAARDAMVAGITDALEKLTGVGQAVAEATIDEAAATPPEVGELLKQVSETLIALAGEAAPADAPAAPPPAPAAAPVAAAAPAATEKAGKKISGANLKKLKTAMDAIKAVLEAAEPTSKAAGDDPPEADEGDPVTARIHKMLEGFGATLKERDVASDARIAKLALAIHDKNTTIADQKAAIVKAKEQIANLAKRANSPGGGNSSEGEGLDPTAKANGGKPKVSWGAWEKKIRKQTAGAASR